MNKKSEDQLSKVKTKMGMKPTDQTTETGAALDPDGVDTPKIDLPS